MTYEEEREKLYSQEIPGTLAKEQEMLRLIQVKAEKLVNDYLIKQEHTQLSYLSKAQRESRIAMPKGILIDKILAYLRSI